MITKIASERNRDPVIVGLIDLPGQHPNQVAQLGDFQRPLRLIRRRIHADKGSEAAEPCHRICPAYQRL